jgi:hypothetical protein
VALWWQESVHFGKIFTRLHQRDSYGHSFIALHSVFIAGVTMCYCLFISPTLWTVTVSNDLRACSSALFVMAERTPVVKKYRDALENVMNATMEFLARAPANPNQDPALTSPVLVHGNISRASPPSHRDLPGVFADFSPGFTGAAQESFVRGTPKVDTTPDVNGDGYSSTFVDENSDVYSSMPQVQTQASPGAEGRWEGRQGELGQMDAEWMLSLCEGEGFSLQMLNEMMRFEPSLGA